MGQVEAPDFSNVVAVYPDHTAAEQAVRRLHEAGIALGDLSIVGRDFQMTEEPFGFVSVGDYVKAGAETGAWFGGLFGLLIGAGFLVLPGLGLVVVAGPVSVAVLAAIEGALAGGAVGSLGGARRLGCSARPGNQIREAGQGGEIPRHRPVEAGGRRSRPEPARPPRGGPRRHLRVASVNPDRPRLRPEWRAVDQSDQDTEE